MQVKWLRHLAVSGIGSFAAATAGGAFASPAADPGDAEMTVLPERHALLVTGPIGERFEYRMRRLLASYPDVDLVIMRGPGGMRGQALRAASLLNERRVRVRIDGRCASACALLWAAAKSREMTDDSKLGLHGSSLPGAEALPEAVRAQIIARNDRETDDVLRSAGFPEPIVAKGAATPPSSMSWFGAAELAQQGVPFDLRDADRADEVDMRAIAASAAPGASPAVTATGTADARPATGPASDASDARAAEPATLDLVGDRIRGSSREPSVGRRIAGWFACVVASRCERHASDSATH